MSVILKAFTDDLTDKYKKEQVTSQSYCAYLSENIIKTLTDDEITQLDQPLSFEELTKALHDIKKGKSPGSNGFTAPFFRTFWIHLGPFLHRSFIFGTHRGSMIGSHREGVITMIPKSGKPPDNVKGWRPITLLNTDYKIISAAVSKRLQKVMDNLIDPCQTAYIKGRYIGENTRLVFDVINHIHNKNKSGIILSADFEAAFDTLSWDFVSYALIQYKSGTYFRSLIDLLYLNQENFSMVILNGYLGNKIYLNRGIRQGDPASGYLFNLAVNTLANQIKRSQLLTGIQLLNSEIRISQYADDTLLFLHSSQYIDGALQELRTFSEASGLGLNIGKTSCLEIGMSNNRENNINTGIKQVNSLKILGITFTNTISDITENNIEPKLKQIEKEISQWLRRNLTPIGRIVVTKSLLLSKLVHLFTALPNPTEAYLKKNRTYTVFLCMGK